MQGFASVAGHKVAMRNSIRCLCCLLACVAPAASHAAESFDGDHIKVELINDQMPLPGQTAWMGIVLNPDPGWHTYWINPGDSGLPTKLDWTVPAGFKAGEIAWPAPKRFKIDGLYNFGYDDVTLLPVPIEVPSDTQPGSSAHLAVMAKWLVCREECIPGSAELTFDLLIRKQVPVAAQPRNDVIVLGFSEAYALFGDARRRLPKTANWQAESVRRGERIEVTLHGADFPKSAALDAFAVQTKVVANAPPKIETRGGDLVLTFAKSDYFTSMPDQFDLVLTDGHRDAWLVHAPFAATKSSTSVNRENSP
jgi:DsbC/DsbD-like thiol-disulfide interchange protein